MVIEDAEDDTSTDSFAKQRQEAVPKLSAFLELRSDDDFYRSFCKRFLKCVVGDKVWRSNWLKVPMTQFVSVTDEAFALLVIVNCHERWRQMFIGTPLEDGTEAMEESDGEGKHVSMVFRTLEMITVT